jgi:hypothetical protein
LVSWVMPNPAATPAAITSSATSATGIRQFGGLR